MIIGSGSFEARSTTSLSGTTGSGARPADVVGKTCFVMMPFGVKDGPDGKIDSNAAANNGFNKDNVLTWQ